MSHSDEQSPHRLFAAIVLMGTGLALGCGGISERTETAGPAGGSSPGDANQTSGDSGSSGIVGTGGAVQTPPLNVAGSSVQPVPMPLEPVKPGPFTCPTEQWACSAKTCDYNNQSRGLVLPEACGCDVTRPRSPKDCAAGQAFVCQRITAMTDGRPLVEPLNLACSCQTKNDSCEDVCDSNKIGYVPCEWTEDQLGILCGCAIPYLK